MEFLEKLALPHSSEHMELLSYILDLTLILFIPYVSVLLGSLIFSLIFRFLGSRNNNELYIRFSKSLLDIVTPNKSAPLALGVVPALSIILCYAQFLTDNVSKVTGFLSISFVLFLISLVFIYTYKYSFHLKQIFEKSSSDDETVKKEIENYKHKSEVLYSSSGGYGLIFLFLSIFIFIGTVKLTMQPDRMDSIETIFGVIFSLSSILAFLQYFTLAFALTAAIGFYHYFRPTSEFKNESEDYISLVRNIMLYSGLTAMILVPVFMSLNLITVPFVSLTTDIFAILFAAIIFALIIINLFYMMLKENSNKYASVSVFLIVIFFALSIVKDQSAFTTAAEPKIKKINVEYEEFAANLKEQYGTVEVAEINGADIYNGKCVACHQWDTKLVGPPHMEVMPKYEGNAEELASYILNPQKVNPEYPAMPSQGLKPAEADAVAEYLLYTYEEKKAQ